MSIFGRLVAILLISFLAMAPGLAGTAAPVGSTCDMAEMHHASGHGEMTGKALTAICKMQCQAPAMLTQPVSVAREIALALCFPSMVAQGLPSRSNPPEAPPPRS